MTPWVDMLVVESTLVSLLVATRGRAVRTINYRGRVAGLAAIVVLRPWMELSPCKNYRISLSDALRRLVIARVDRASSCEFAKLQPNSVGVSTW